MCDYSLQFVTSRPAKVGDKLVTTNFPNTSTRGFASPDDSSVAVCVLPGTEIAFEQEAQYETSFLRLRRPIGYKAARFRRIDQDRSNVHHDALEFPDGKMILLTQLCAGQCATVLQLPAHPAARREAKNIIRLGV
jgi:hypothetical protein